MFVRCKKIRSGSANVQIVNESSGNYVLIQTVRSSTDSVEIDFLIAKDKKLIASHGGQAILPFDKDKELAFVDTFLQCLNR